MCQKLVCLVIGIPCAMFTFCIVHYSRVITLRLCDSWDNFERKDGNEIFGDHSYLAVIRNYFQLWLSDFQTPVASHTRRVSHKAENSEEEAEDSESDDCEHQHRRQHRSGSSKRRHSSHAAPVFSPLHYAPYVGGGGGYLPGLYSSPLNRPLALSPWSSVSSLGLFSSPYSPRDERTTVPAPPPPPGMRPSWSFPLLNGEKVGDGVPAASGIGGKFFFVDAEGVDCPPLCAWIFESGKGTGLSMA